MRHGLPPFHVFVMPWSACTDLHTKKNVYMYLQKLMCSVDSCITHALIPRKPSINRECFCQPSREIPVQSLSMTSPRYST